MLSARVQRDTLQLHGTHLLLRSQALVSPPYQESTVSMNGIASSPRGAPLPASPTYLRAPTKPPGHSMHAVLSLLLIVDDDQQAFQGPSCIDTSRLGGDRHVVYAGANGRPRLAHCGYIPGTSWRYLGQRAFLCFRPFCCAAYAKFAKTFDASEGRPGCTYTFVNREKKLDSRGRAGLMSLLRWSCIWLLHVCDCITLSHHPAHLLVLRLVLASFIV
jgi:hypothetical protein